MPNFQPTPERWGVETVTSTTGEQLLVIQIESANSVHCSFLTADDAKGLAATILQHANQAATGLILPPTNGHGPLHP